MKITALDEHHRKIEWHACWLVSAGSARTQRWLGLLGIYDPADEYFGKDGETVVILLGGGTKKRQDRDIATAHERWSDYKHRKTREM